MPRLFSRTLRLAAVACSVIAPSAAAQAIAMKGDPAPPAGAATISRDTAGHATVRAIKLTKPLVVDGILDDDVYTQEQPFGGLLQVVPDYGAESTEKSEI